MHSSMRTADQKDPIFKGLGQNLTKPPTGTWSKRRWDISSNGDDASKDKGREPEKDKTREGKGQYDL